MGRLENGLRKRDKIGETRTEMSNSESSKPNLIFVFNKNVLKPRFLGLKKDCMSQDSNPGPQHWNLENRPVGFM